jgi:hypothetical protein
MRVLICPVCGEEYDLDDLHEEVAVRRQEGATASFTVVLRQFQREGCSVALRASQGPLDCRTDASTAELAGMAQAIYELLGDDVDGAINEIEDYRLMFGQ